MCGVHVRGKIVIKYERTKNAAGNGKLKVNFEIAAAARICSCICVTCVPCTRMCKLLTVRLRKSKSKTKSKAKQSKK